MNIATCRFCGNFCWPGDMGCPHDPAVDYAVRYGKRHNAHLRCAVERNGPEWIKGLHTWQIEMLPDGVVRELGLGPTLAAELERRSHLNPASRLRHNLRG